MRIENLIERYSIQIAYLQEAIKCYRYNQKNKLNTLRYKNDIKLYCSNARGYKREIEYIKRVVCGEWGDENKE